MLNPKKTCIKNQLLTYNNINVILKINKIERGIKMLVILKNNVQRFYNECCQIAKREVINDPEFLNQVDIIVQNILMSQNELFKYPSYSQAELKGMAKAIYNHKT